MADYETLTDRELAIAAANGDQRAPAALYDRYFAEVYDFAVRTLRNADAAADVVQRTFTDVSGSLAPGTVPENVNVWLYSIALSQTTARAREMSQAVSPTQQPDIGPAPFVQMDPARAVDFQPAQQEGELRELVWQSATELSPREYALLDLNLRREMDAGQLAAVVGISPQSAEATLSTLRDSFEDAVTASFLLQRGREECPELVELLARTTASTASPEIRQAVVAHLETCQQCMALTAAIPGPSSVLSGFADVPAAAGVKEVIWGNVLAAPAVETQASAVAAAPVGRRRRSLLIALLLGLAALAVIALLVALFAGDGGDAVADPDDIRSTSHEIGEPSTDPVVRMVWSRQEGVQAYSVSWSEEAFELPDEVGDLTGRATETRSPELEPGDWFFHLRTQRADGTWTSTVHVGPFEVEPEPEPTEESTPEPTPTPEEEPTPTEEPATPLPTPEDTPEPETPTPAPTQT
jgi:DNA-directed RNA polymerase specialized sigma24 family protein